MVKKRQRRLLLVALSPERQRLLLEETALVRDLLRARTQSPIPSSLELDEQWVELQRALFDFLWLSGEDDVRAEALTPRSGLTLYEDRNVESARIVPAETCRTIGEWVATLPADCVERARRAPKPSPASRAFPESLGTSESDDEEPLREGTTLLPKKNRYDARELNQTLDRVRTFYAELLPTGRALLAIRFRE